MADDSLLQDDDETIRLPRNLLSLGTSYNNNNNTNTPSSNVTPLEQEVLDEYERLLSNMNQLTKTLADLSSGPITLEIAESLRLLERKVASVYTLMKASVYSIVLQQGQVDQTVLEGDETMR